MSPLAAICADCGTITPETKRGRCPACAAPIIRAENQRRKPTAARGYGAAHQRRSRLARAAQPWCSECGATEDLTADHVVPLALGGDPLGPLRVLCRRCNSRRGDRADDGGAV